MKPKKIKLSPDEMNYGLFEKHEYRGYEIRVYNTKSSGTDWFYGTDLSCGNPAKSIDFDYEDDNAEAVVEAAVEAIDRKLDSPKEARKRLKNCDTQTLLNIFYSYATSAPAWADEVMEMVAEKKKRAWLISQIADELLTDDELIEEMGV
jgi:hypothetical protein